MESSHKVYLLALVGYEDFDPKGVYSSLEKAKAAMPGKWRDQKNQEYDIARIDNWDTYFTPMIFELPYE